MNTGEVVAATRPPTSGSSSATSQRRRAARAGGDRERGAGRRADVPARPEQRPGRAGGAARAERQGRARPRLSVARGRGGRHPPRRQLPWSDARRSWPRSSPSSTPRSPPAAAGWSRSSPRRASASRAWSRSSSTRSARPRPPSRPLPPVRAGHHVLAAGRDRPRGGRNRGRGRAGRRAREDREPGRRCRGDRAVAAAVGLDDGDFPVPELFWGVRKLLESIAWSGRSRSGSTTSIGPRRRCST